MRHIAAVVLNYNSNNDLFRCVDLLKKQKGILLSIIVIDNCSNKSSIKELEKWIENSDVKIINVSKVNTEEIKEQNTENNKIYFIFNHENKGYSAGNNIGLKFANQLEAEASLIVNPDMIIEDENYIRILSDEMFSTKHCAVSSSKVITLEGKDQNPSRESTFYEELFWFRSLIKPISYLLPIKGNKSVSVPKVSGCCMLLNNIFLQKINYLDEKVFLYCEEPILSAQVKREKYNILYVPYIEVIHAHIKSEKSNSSERMLEMIKSRKYYLGKYSGYSKLKILTLNISYFILEFIYKAKRRTRL